MRSGSAGLAASKHLGMFKQGRRGMSLELQQGIVEKGITGQFVLTQGILPNLIDY